MLLSLYTLDAIMTFVRSKSEIHLFRLDKEKIRLCVRPFKLHCVYVYMRSTAYALELDALGIISLYSICGYLDA
jgi:hypothetical protein